MKKVLALASSVLFGLLLSGCTQRPSSVGSDEAQNVVNHLTYTKDTRTNTCYALVASRHVTDWNQNGFTITYVPCTPEVEALIAK